MSTFKYSVTIASSVSSWRLGKGISFVPAVFEICLRWTGKKTLCLTYNCSLCMRMHACICNNKIFLCSFFPSSVFIKNEKLTYSSKERVSVIKYALHVFLSSGWFCCPDSHVDFCCCSIVELYLEFPSSFVLSSFYSLM